MSSSTEYGGDLNLTWPPRSGVHEEVSALNDDDVDALQVNDSIPVNKRRCGAEKKAIDVTAALCAKPMNMFAAQMQEEGKKNVQGDTIPDYMTNDADSGLRMRTSSLFRALDTAPTKDRWDLIDPNVGPNLTDLPEVEGNTAKTYERLGPPLSRSYIHNFLRPARRQRGERPCCAGNDCQGILMHQRSHYHRYGTAGFVVRELLMPAEERELTVNGKSPEKVGYCVLCTRFMVSRWCKVRNMTGSASFGGLLCSHSVTTDIKGEYDSTTCLYASNMT